MLNHEEKPSSSIPGFLTKTYEIFTLPEYRYCCDWGADGNSIVVTKIEEFSKQVLPKYFKHSNFQSFVRQLNMYDFHKVVQDPNNGEFTHQNFLRDHPERLCYIKRKANNRPSIESKKTSTPVITDEILESKFGIKGEDFQQEADSVINDLNEQWKIRNDFERRLQETEEKLRGLSKLEAKQSYLESENLFLKQMVLDSRNKQIHMQAKMERVLKLMYSAYISSGGALSNGHRQTVIDNGLQGILAIEDGSAVNMSSILGEFGGGGAVNTTDSPFEYSISRLNSLKSSVVDDSQDFSLSRLNSLLKSTDGDDFTDELSDPFLFDNSGSNNYGSSSGKPSITFLQGRNISATSRAFQGQELCRLHSLDDDGLLGDPVVAQGSGPSKRPRVDDVADLGTNISQLHQQELDLLHRNQDLTLNRIDSLESTISNLLDFIDESFDGNENEIVTGVITDKTIADKNETVDKNTSELKLESS